MPNKGKPRPFATYIPGGALLDDVNVRLLQRILANPRITMSALARSVEMSAPAVTERVQRLERAGVIAGYRIDLDPEALGRPIAAFVRVRPAPGQLPRVADLAASIAEVTECHRITGEDCFLLKVHAASMQHLESILDRFLVHGQTTTSIVQTTPVAPRPLPLPSIEFDGSEHDRAAPASSRRRAANGRVYH